MRIGRDNNRYAKNTACADCGAAVEWGFLYCPPCSAARLDVYRGAVARSKEGPGPNLIGCCGGRFVPLLTNPLRTSCCGRVLAVSREEHG